MPPITWNAILLGCSFVVAAIIFVVTMKPRLDALEKQIGADKADSKERDAAISKMADSVNALAVTVAEVVVMEKNTRELIHSTNDRLDKFIQAAFTNMNKG